MATLLDPRPECCPEFYPVPWNDQVFTWDNKKFIKDRVFTIFYIPMNFGQVMKRLDQRISAADASVPDYLCLSDHTSKWSMDLFLAVDKEVVGAENTTMSGKFYCRVYEGPYKDTGIWSKDFEEKAQAKGFTIKKWYMWYTTCPKCVKKYGKNYVVIVGQIE